MNGGVGATAGWLIGGPRRRPRLGVDLLHQHPLGLAALAPFARAPGREPGRADAAELCDPAGARRSPGALVLLVTPCRSSRRPGWSSRIRPSFRLLGPAHCRLRADRVPFRARSCPSHPSLTHARRGQPSDAPFPPSRSACRSSSRFTASRCSATRLSSSGSAPLSSRPWRPSGRSSARLRGPQGRLPGSRRDRAWRYGRRLPAPHTGVRWWQLLGDIFLGLLVFGPGSASPSSPPRSRP